MTAPTPGIVARWTIRRRPASGTRCDECGEVLHGSVCGQCGQLAGPVVGMIATVIDTADGLRLVIAERTGRGDWTPIRTLPATQDNVNALTRPGATGPEPPAARLTGSLW